MRKYLFIFLFSLVSLPSLAQSIFICRFVATLPNGYKEYISLYKKDSGEPYFTYKATHKVETKVDVLNEDTIDNISILTLKIEGNPYPQVFEMPNPIVMHRKNFDGTITVFQREERK
jgi:hypothetical protein